MKVQGQHTFDAARPTVWKALMDPEVIARIMPGCEALDEVGENAYEGAMKIKVGPVQGLFKGNVELTELVEPESYHIRIKGKGAPGFVEAAGTVALAEEEGATRLDYEIDAKIGGRIASVGQRLLESSTKVIARQSLEGLAEQIAALEPAAGGGSAAEAPSPSRMAAGFVVGMLEDLVPAPVLPLLGIGAGFGIGAAAIAIFILIFQACSAY